MLSVTPAHALQTEAGEWRAAGQLQAGDHVRSIKGSVTIDSTYTESVSPTAVISYELEGGEAYVVGEMPVVVAGTCDLKTIKEALGTEFSAFQNRIFNLGLKTAERAELYRDFVAGNQQLRNLLKTEEGLKAWKILSNFPHRSNTKYLQYVDNLRNPVLGNATAPYLTDYAKRFKDFFPEIAANVYQVHHAIPQKVKNTFNLIQDPALHSLENLRGIPQGSNFHQTITTRWNQWYNANPNFTLQNALDYAKQIDNEFGHLFIPPIR
jgi:hypothetical protein